MADNPTIHWTPEKLKWFRKAYDEAEARGAKEFIWDGHEFVLGYAKYLISFLEEKLNDG
jgi:hypothetical protein